MDKAELNKAYFEAGDWLHTTYRGIQVLKYTTDLWRYKEIIEETAPDLLIETGTMKGGSAAYFASMVNRVVTIDIQEMPEHRFVNIDYILGDSLSAQIFEDMELRVAKATRVMVVLDSNHSKEHVLTELKQYAPLVSKGCYLVVEDTFLSQYLHNQDPNNDYSDGSSWEAVQEWDSTGFEVQQDIFTISMNPGGWFKRV